METPATILSPSSEVRLLEQQTFDIAFEMALEQLAGGVPFTQFCTEYPSPSPSQPLDPTRFRAWIWKDQKRKQAYLVAKALGAEAVEDELIRISDGLGPDNLPSPNEVDRSKLQIDTRKWLLQVWNRRRYGDVKHIEQTTTTRVDVSSLSTDELRAKVLQGLGFEAESGPDSPFEDIL
jgi:hypothetical protein